VGISGILCSGISGMVCSGIDSSIRIESELSESFINVTFEIRIKTRIIIARAHVLLSRKSVVLFTPPICCCPQPKVEDRPPPLGF
jgi:hypothetical protein